MSVTYVSSESELIAWNGVGDVALTASFLLTDPTKYPISYSSSFFFDGNGQTLSVVFNSQTDIFNGLLRKANATANVTISRLTFQLNKCTLQTFTGALIGSQRNNFLPNSINPSGTFLKCSVVSNPTVTLSGRHGLYIGSINNVATTSGSTPTNLNISFTQCSASILNSTITQSTGRIGCFIGFISTGGNYLPNITFSKCYASFYQSGSGVYVYSGALIGVCNQMTCTVDQTYTRLDVQSASNLTDRAISASFGYLDNPATITITNSYSLVLAPTTTPPVSSYPVTVFGVVINSPISYTVNSYYVLVSTGNAIQNYYKSSGTVLSIADSAYNVTQMKWNTTAVSTNNLTSYTTETDTNVLPFTGWSTSLWGNLPNTSPPILLAFTQSPYSNYTVYNDVPINLACIYDGDFLLFNGKWKHVSDIVEGDVLETFDGKPTRVVHVDTFIVRSLPQFLPYRIPKHSFSDFVPTRDVYVAPGHALCFSSLSGWQSMIHPRCTDTFKATPIDDILLKYYRIRTENDTDLICMNGLWVETWTQDYNWECSLDNHSRCKRLGPTLSPLSY